MRWSDEYLGYLAVIAGFAAAVLWAQDVPSVIVVTLFTVAAALLLLMFWSYRHTGKVLVVGSRRTEPVDLLEEALDDAGYGLTYCSGPGARPCPVYAGKPCPVHGRPVAAVIVRDPGETMPVPPCGRALHIPALPLEADDRLPAEAVADLEALRAAY